MPDKTEKVSKWAFSEMQERLLLQRAMLTRKGRASMYMYINDPGALVEDIGSSKSNTFLVKANRTFK